MDAVQVFRGLNVREKRAPIQAPPGQPGKASPEAMAAMVAAADRVAAATAASASSSLDGGAASRQRQQRRRFPEKVY